MKNILLTMLFFACSFVGNLANAQSKEPEELKVPENYIKSNVSSSTTQPTVVKTETQTSQQLEAQRARLAAERSRSVVNTNEGKAARVEQTQATKPTVQVQKAADADARAMERKHEPKQVAPGVVSNSTDSKHAVESKTTTVQQQVAKTEVHYGPKTNRPSGHVHSADVKELVKHPEINKPTKVSAPKSGVK